MTQPTLTPAERAELADLLAAIEAADAKLTQRPRRANSEQAKARRLQREERERKMARQVAAEKAASQPDQAQRDARRLQQAQEGRERKPLDCDAHGPAHVSFIERDCRKLWTPAECIAEETAIEERRLAEKSAQHATWTQAWDDVAADMGLSRLDRHEATGDDYTRFLGTLTHIQLLMHAEDVFVHGFRQPPAKHTPIALGRFTRDSEREAIPSKRSTRGVSGI